MPADAARILIVEDEALVGLFLADVLEELGCTVVGRTATGEAALDLAAQGGCDLAFVDLGLAGRLGGLETAAALGDRHGIPVVLMSGASEAALAAEAGAVKSVGILSKPFLASDVEAVLAAAAERR